MAEDELLDEVAEAVVVFGGGFDDAVDLEAIERLELTATAVGEQALGEHAGELVLAAEQELFELSQVLEGLAAGQLAGGIDRAAFRVLIALRADGVEALQGEAERVDFAMALVAGGMAAML